MRRRRSSAGAGEETGEQPRRGRHAAAAAELDAAAAEFLAEPSEPPPAPDPWAPIVVDQPIFEFEAKPPASLDSYRPDTIFDGWSGGRYTVRLASVRGYSHRYSGTPRQDDAAAAFEPVSGAVIFAVADGVSSARESHIGATAACQTALREASWQLASQHPVDWTQVVTVAAQALAVCASDLLDEDRPLPDAVEELVATTLVAGCVVPTRQGTLVSMTQIGDSGAWVLQRGRYHPVLAEKHDPNAQVISSAVSPLPRIPAELPVAEFHLAYDSVLLVGTDGFGDPLGEGDGKIGQLFTHHLATPPPARALAHLLDFSRETFDDDRTLLAIWPQAEARPG